MRTIRERLTFNFILIIVITVVFLEALLIYNIKDNYYKNLEGTLLNQIRVSSDLYNRYFSDQTLSENVMNNVDTFWKQANCEVQIIDTKGTILMDSIGALWGEGSQYNDIEQALKGNNGTYIGKVDYDDSKVLAVSYPLKQGDKIVGALRFITSLKEVDSEIQRITVIFIALGILVVCISGGIALLLSNSIVSPIKEVIKAAMLMAGGDFNSSCKKLHDDEIGQLSDTLNYMALEITKRDQIKNDFISSVSHELRTPLTSIKGWAVTLKELGLEDKNTLQDGLNIIEQESDRLTKMVEELLDFSRFVSGKITLKKEKVNVKSIMERVKIQMGPRISHENIKFIMEYDENIPEIISDENRLKQIFINLIDNAIRFTPENGTISFSAISYREFVQFNVRDSGSGINEEDLPRVKEKFYKGKSSKSNNGIGLSICDEIVTLMGGELNIYSKEGEGTDVSFTILKE